MLVVPAPGTLPAPPYVPTVSWATQAEAVIVVELAVWVVDVENVKVVAVVCEELIVYVPVPPDPVPKEAIVVPAAMPYPYKY